MRSTILALIAFLLILPAVSAASTIHVKTIPAHDVLITVVSPNSDAYLDGPIKSRADMYGEVTHTYSGSTDKFNVLVLVKWQGTQKYREEFGPYENGETVEIELLPEDYVDISQKQEGSSEETPDENSEETSNEEAESQDPNDETADTEETDEEEGDNSGITGNVVSRLKEDEGLMKNVYYGIGGIVIVGLILFLVLGISAKKKKAGIQYGMKPVKLSGPPPAYISETDKELDKLQNEISSVEKEISAYKKRNKLFEAEKVLEEKKRLLAQMKKQENHEDKKPTQNSDQDTPKKFSDQNRFNSQNKFRRDSNDFSRKF